MQSIEHPGGSDEFGQVVASEIRLRFTGNLANPNNTPVLAGILLFKS